MTALREALFLCECGCGEPVRIAPYNYPQKGHVQGQPVRFRPGHHRRGQILITPDRYEIDPDTGCWNWLLAIRANGYGAARHTSAHRVSYEEHVGPIPEGFDVDHLCRNRACVNPAHLEPVTRRENNRRKDVCRGIAPATPEDRSWLERTFAPQG